MYHYNEEKSTTKIDVNRVVTRFGFLASRSINKSKTTWHVLYIFASHYMHADFPRSACPYSLFCFSKLREASSQGEQMCVGYAVLHSVGHESRYVSRVHSRESESSAIRAEHSIGESISIRIRMYSSIPPPRRVVGGSEVSRSVLPTTPRGPKGVNEQEAVSARVSQAAGAIWFVKLPAKLPEKKYGYMYLQNIKPRSSDTAKKTNVYDLATNTISIDIMEITRAHPP
jgi:hypothetical protein